MAVNFTKNQDEITKAWRNVVDHKDAQNWALFGYDGTTNNIKLTSTGASGLAELVSEFNCSLIQYAFCRVINKENAINKLILINWQGESAPLSRKGLCASHVGDVANYFKGCTQTITIRNDDEATEEYLMEQIMRISSSKIGFTKPVIEQQKQQPADSTTDNDGPSSVGSTYKKTDIRSEIAVDRKSFWQRQEEEEKERIQEEKKRAAERQAQFERERKMREESEAKKLAETIKERDRIIEATRQAEKQQQSSSGSAANASQEQDDGRVGRRSELIRLERNQETQSLISKGLIKNKRAIFEQASQQQQTNGQQASSNLTRRPSGTIVTQRLNTFQSVDANGGGGDITSSNQGSSVEKLTNGFTKQVSVSDNGDGKTAAVVKQHVEIVKLTNDEKETPVSQTVTRPPPPSEATKEDVKISPSKKVQEVPKSPNESNGVQQNGNKTPVVEGVVASADENGNNEDTKNSKSQPADTILRSGEGGIKAIALYDYQASDNTEISFDPDDIIGFIDKVDVGWWQGTVLTGQYKGQTGLFPQNYVNEVDSI